MSVCRTGASHVYETGLWLALYRQTQDSRSQPAKENRWKDVYIAAPYTGVCCRRVTTGPDSGTSDSRRHPVWNERLRYHGTSAQNGAGVLFTKQLVLVAGKQ